MGAFRTSLVMLLVVLAGCAGSQEAPDETEDHVSTLQVPEGCDAPIFPGIRGREVDVAVDPDDPSRVAAIAMVTPPGWEGTVPSPYDVALWTGLARSSDGGQTWQTTILPNWPGDTDEPIGPFTGGAALGDGIVGFAPDGDLYVSAILLTGLLQYNMLSMRFPGDSLEPMDVTVFSRGAYGDPRLNDVPGFNPAAYNDKQDQAIDPDSGGWYVSWMWRSNVQGMRTVPVVAFSPDGGTTWEGPVMLVDAVGAGLTSDDAHLAPAPLILGDSVFVLWTKVGSNAIWAAQAPRDTLEFGEPYEIASLDGGGQASNILTLPMINVAVGPGPGGIGERAYVTAIRGGDGYDVGLWYSDDGLEWVGLITPHADTTHNQMLPTVAVAPDGRIASQFVDFSEDPENVRYHVVAAVSDDGGQSWQEHRLTREPTDTQHAGDAVQGHVGDYFGNAWTSAGLLGAWQDGREGTADDPYTEIYGCVVTEG